MLFEASECSEFQRKFLAAREMIEISSPGGGLSPAGLSPHPLPPPHPPSSSISPTTLGLITEKCPEECNFLRYPADTGSLGVVSFFLVIVFIH